MHSVEATNCIKKQAFIIGEPILFVVRNLHPGFSLCIINDPGARLQIELEGGRNTIGRQGDRNNNGIMEHDTRGVCNDIMHE